MIGRLFRAIKQKPKSVRDQYAFWIAGVCTSCVVLVWFMQLPERFESSTDSQSVPQDTTEELGGLFGGFSEQVASIREEFSSEETLEATTTIQNTTTTSVASTTVDFEFASSSVGSSTSSVQVESQTSIGRPVRIATTTASTTP